MLKTELLLNGLLFQVLSPSLSVSTQACKSANSDTHLDFKGAGKLVPK